MCRSYNPAKSNISSHVSIVGRSLDNYGSSYDNFLVTGGLNSEISEMAMSKFCETYNLQNLVKDPSKPTCIDLILTNFSNPANIYLFKVNNRNTRKRCEMCSEFIRLS